MKKLLLCSLVLLAACTSHEKKNAAKILHLNLVEDPGSLDPRCVRMLRNFSLTMQLFDGLMRLDSNGKPQLAIASHVEISDDLTTYTFSLRDAKWINGDPVTAHDFVYAWQSLLDPKFPSDYAFMLFPIKNAQKAKEGKCTLNEIGVKAQSDQVLVVELEKPTPYFLEIVALPSFFPLHVGSDETITNGPFCIDKWETDVELSLKKSPSYWDASSVHLDGLNFTILSDGMTEGYLFEKGVLDWLGQPLSQAMTAELREKLNHDGKVSSYPVAGTFWFVFNTQKAPFDNVNLRKALSYATPRMKVIEHILQGGQTPATSILPPSMALQNEPYFQDEDLKEAKRLFELALSEQGLTKADIEPIVLSYSPSERNTRIVQLVGEQWHKTFQVKIVLEAAELHVHKKNLKMGKFQVGTGEWVADFNDPLAFLDIFKFMNDKETGAGVNPSGWHNERYVALLDQSSLETDPEKRKTLLKEALQLLVSDMPVDPIYHYSFDYVSRKGVSDVVLHPLGIADFKQAKIE